MKDKFCVSKTLVYLVVLVAAVVGTFFLTNYANEQNLTSDSEAAGKGRCVYASTKNYLGGCSGLAAAYKTLFTADPSRDRKDKDGNITSRCCIPEKKPTAVPGSVVTCSSTGGKWYKTDRNGTTFKCGDIGAGYSQSAKVTEKVSGYTCCVTTRLPTVSIVQKTCKQQGGNWYRSSSAFANGFDSCNDLSEVVQSPFGNPTQVPADKKFYQNYLCCVPKKVPTAVPTTP